MLDRLLIADTFACRVSKGPDHDILLVAIRKRIKGSGIGLIEAILRGWSGRQIGLPIGALSSQHFANFYLGAFDRFVLDQPGICGYVRYMDDMVWFFRQRAEGQGLLAPFENYFRDRLKLALKRRAEVDAVAGEVQAGRQGLSFCGFRVFPDRLGLSRRRQRRYTQARRRWEEAYSLGLIGPGKLQAGYASALAITAATESRSFRSRDLRLRQPPEV